MGDLSKSNSKILNLLLSFIAFVWIFPFLFVLINSIKSGTEFNVGNFWDIPKIISIGETISYINSRIYIWSGFFNSMLYGVVASILAITFAALASYAITKLNIKGKFYWFLLIYSGTVFPFQMYIIPIYKAYSVIGLYDTQLGMILFYSAICIPFCTFVLRNFFSAISKEVHEAATIDGATNLKIFYKIYLPLAKGPISALFLFQFSFIWNDFLFGLTFSKSSNIRPIMPLISSLAGANGATSNVPAVLLTCIIASIPTLAIYILLNKNFEQGFVVTSK